jgi:TAZ zinc finger
MEAVLLPSGVTRLSSTATTVDSSLETCNNDDDPCAFLDEFCGSLPYEDEEDDDDEDDLPRRAREQVFAPNDYREYSNNANDAVARATHRGPAYRKQDTFAFHPEVTLDASQEEGPEAKVHLNSISSFVIPDILHSDSFVRRDSFDFHHEEESDPQCVLSGLSPARSATIKAIVDNQNIPPFVLPRSAANWEVQSDQDDFPDDEMDEATAIPHVLPDDETGPLACVVPRRQDTFSDEAVDRDSFCSFRRRLWQLHWTATTGSSALHPRHAASCTDLRNCRALFRLYQHIQHQHVDLFLKTLDDGECHVPGCHWTRRLWQHALQCRRHCTLCQVIPPDSPLWDPTYNH